MVNDGTPESGPVAVIGWAPAGSVLVIDDEPSVLSVTKRYLERAGITALTALDPGTALTTFNQHRDGISAVLIDLTLREVGGERLLEDLRAQVPGLPALLMSGNFTSDSLVDPRTGYVAKPFRGPNLVRLLRTVVEGEA
jgi:DNA-binding NtrC family response regulator